MASSLLTAACGAVAVVGVTLVTVGPPREHIQEAASAALPAAPSPLNALSDSFKLQSVNVEFPSSDRDFPGGDAAQTVVDNCTACHSPGMILNQPALTAVQWQAEINHMRNDFKAPVADGDVAAIVAYLVATKGAE